MRLGMWITSCPEAMGRGFWVIFFFLKAVSWDSDLGEASWFSSFGEAKSVGCTRCAARGGVRRNSQHSKNCVSLSSCWKPKSQEGNESFVPELKIVVSVSGFPMYISHIHILVLFWWLCYIFTNPFSQAGYDTRSIFKRSSTGLNSKFSFSLTTNLNMAEEPSLPYYLSIAGGRIIVFIPFPGVLVLCEIQSVSTSIWTRGAVSISHDDNHYTTGTSTTNWQ